MPRGRRHRGGRPGGWPHEGARSSPRQQKAREQALAEYALWRIGPTHGEAIAAGHAVDVESETLLLELLLRLKTEQLASPDLGHWDEEVTTRLLTELMPRTVIQVRAATMDLVPVLTRFFAFLQETGRWSETSMSRVDAARVLPELEFAVLEAADDPSRRSFSTNILGYGLEHGLDPRDEAALAGYIDWYDSLPDVERTELSSTGRLHEPSSPYDPETMRGEPIPRSDGGGDEDENPDEDRDGNPDEDWCENPDEGRDGNADDGRDGAADPASRPDGAGREPAADADSSAEDEASLAARLDRARRSALVQRAVILLETIGEGAPVTGTVSPDLRTTAEVMARLGIDRPARSIWEVPEIVGAWIALIDGGWLLRQGHWIVPSEAGRGSGGRYPLRSADEDPEAFVGFAHAVMVSLLAGLGARAAEEGGLRGMPDTAAALVRACESGGLVLRDPATADDAELPADALAGLASADDQQTFENVRSDLEDLAVLGLLEADGDRFTGSTAVLRALHEAMRILRDLETDD